VNDSTNEETTEDGTQETTNGTYGEWSTFSGEWAPTSGSMVFYSSSGSMVSEYTLDPESSTNVDLTISGSGSSYNLTIAGSLNFGHSAGTGSGASGIRTNLSGLDGTYTVSDGNLYKSFSYLGASGSLTLQRIDDDHLKAVAEETNSETALDEGAVRDVRTISFTRVK